MSRGRLRLLDRVERAAVSRASESRWHFSGREPDSAPGSLSPARPRRKQTRTAARSDRPTRTASPLKAPPGQKSASSLRKVDLPKEKRASVSKLLQKKRRTDGPGASQIPLRGRFRPLASKANENRRPLRSANLKVDLPGEKRPPFKPIPYDPAQEVVNGRARPLCEA